MHLRCITFHLSCVLLIPASVQAQIANFDGNGKRTNSVSESVVIAIDTFPEEKIPSHLAPLIGAIAGPLADFAVSAVTAHLKSREASFTGQYQGFCSASSFYRNGRFNIDKIEIIRKIWEHEQEKEASRIVLKAERQGELFRLKVDSVFLHYSKARIRNSDDHISLNIDMEIIGNWREMDAKNQVHIKSVSLGKSSVEVDHIAPGTSAAPAAVYSDWFLMIPLALASDKQGGSGWYSIKATVKEANARGISSKKIYDFFHDTGSEMADLLNALAE